MTFGFVLFSVFFLVAFGVDSASGNGVSVSNHTLSINTTTQVKAHVPIEKIWNGLSKVHRYPIINSGDTIALRSAYTSGYMKTYWLYCTSSFCAWTTCYSSTTTDTKWWSSCTWRSMFTITAKGKMHGQPIDSGDTVSLSSNYYNGNSYRLYCTASANTYCCVASLTSYMKGSDWLTYSKATFQIFSKNAVDGTPVQYGDVVGFKYPYSSNSAWFTHAGYRFFPAAVAVAVNHCVPRKIPTLASRYSRSCLKYSFEDRSPQPEIHRKNCRCRCM